MHGGDNLSFLGGWHIIFHARTEQLLNESLLKLVGVTNEAIARGKPPDTRTFRSNASPRTEQLLEESLLKLGVKNTSNASLATEQLL